MVDNARIDVHHHFIPPEYVEAVGRQVAGSVRASGQLPDWTLDRTLELMAAANITSAILSISSPGVGSGSGASHAARLTNELGAEICRNDPGRFGFFATLPLKRQDECLAEIHHAFDVLGADGVTLMTNYEGDYLGAARFRPVLAELNRRRAVVFIHPTSPLGGSPVAGVYEPLIEYPVETARTVVSLLHQGATMAFPDIRFILSHAGGIIPYLVDRIMTLSQRLPEFKTRDQQQVLLEIQKFYYDLAVSVNRGTMLSLLDVVPESHILFGSDWPYIGRPQIEGLTEKLDALALPEATRLRIESENARELFPRFRKQHEDRSGSAESSQV